MKNQINGIVCKIRKHILVHAGTCPFTGSTYQFCERCNAMIPMEIVD